MIRPILFLAILWGCLACADDQASNVSLGPGEGTGIGGSTARFTIRGEYLYAVTDTRLKVLRLREAMPPEELGSFPTFGGLETIFGYEDYLLLGSQSAVYIYDLSQPASPEYITHFSHQTACDPVIAYEDFAYITIRDDQSCRGEFTNQLIALDISDISNPVQTASVDMIRPMGLTVVDGALYVGEGVFGMKKFDISLPHQPTLDTFYTEVPSNDMIGLPGQLIVTGNAGVSQYRIENDSLWQLSIIN